MFGKNKTIDLKLKTHTETLTKPCEQSTHRMLYTNKRSFVISSPKKNLMQ